MRKIIWITLSVALAVVLSSGAAFSWEGRMSGMGDPYGLVSDEADFLTLPSRIVNGEGIKYYGDARFMYHDVMDLNWNAHLNGPIRLNPEIADLLDLNSNLLSARAKGSLKSSGDLYDFSSLVGATFPVGVGRMGIFFNYTGQRGDYNGNMAISAGPVASPTFVSASSVYDMDNSMDNFKLRLIYGQALCDGLNLGLEMQVAYVQDSTDTTNTLRSIMIAGENVSAENGIGATFKNGFVGELFPFMKPYDSSYWEMLFKAGLDGKFGPASVGFVARGGPIFGGDNDYTSSQNIRATIEDYPATAYNAFKLKGDVSGFKVGGDLWVRYPLSDSVSLPFTVRVDYIEKNRDGSGRGTAGYDLGIFNSNSTSLGWDYKYSEKNLDIEAGGGFDMQVSKDLKVAGGLYYNYVETKEAFFLGLNTGYELPADLGNLIVNLNDGEFPNTIKHLVKMKLAAEQNMGTWLMRGGFTVYGGWVSMDWSSALGTPLAGLTNVLGNSASLDGSLWGIMGSFGATVNVGGCKVEPFVQMGYQSLSVDGPGSTTVLGGAAGSAPWSIKRETNELLVGSGFSILF